jgi:hypothetical protein
MAKLWLEWNSTTTQQARNKANGELNDVKSFEFSGITKMRSISRRHCGWSGASTTTQEYETGEKTVLKCLFERAQRRNWRWAACLYQKRRDYHL